MWISVLLLLEVSIKKVVKMLNKHSRHIVRLSHIDLVSKQYTDGQIIEIKIGIIKKKEYRKIHGK